jgi:hypothetical protein
MTLQLIHSEFPKYEENLIFFFISVMTLTLLPLVFLGGGDTLAGHLDHQPIIRELSHLQDTSI